MTRTQTARLPLTAGQKDIWFDEKLTGGGATYNTAIFWDIRGPLDRDRFTGALARLAEESECLRARFCEVEGEPWQTVGELTRLPLTVTDVSGAEDPAEAARAAIREDLRRPFALEGEEPLFRLSVFTLAPDRTFFCLLNHHLVSDGFSYVIYWQRLAAIYQAMTDGASLEEGRFPPLRRLIEAEAAYADSPRQERDRAYWEQRLADRPELVTLSRTDAEPAQGFLREETVLPDALAERLRAVAWESRVTWQTVLVAALGSYTQRMTGAEDVLLSLPVTARVGGTMQAVPGMVVNYLPLRLRVEPGTTRGGLLAETYREFTRALKHQRYRVSAVRRGMGLSSADRRPFGPFVNMMPQIERLSIGPCEAVLHSPSTGLVDDLEFTVADKGAAGVSVDLSGNESRYGQDEVRAHLARFTAYLDRFVTAGGDTRLGALDVLAPGEDEEIARALRGPERAEPYLGVVERVRARAAERPDAPAVRDDTGGVTYAQLAGRASALSRRLPERGLVAVLAEPGVDFVVAELGVLGAGSAFLPLDSASPPARLAALLADSGAVCVLADAANRETAGRLIDDAGLRLPLRVLDSAEDAPGELAPVRGGPQDLAYVIFTSGSTGKPKGAMVQRGGMVNHLCAKIEELSLSASDSLVHNAPVTFDITVWQTLTTLLTGGTVRVVARHTAADPDALFGTIGDEHLTVLEVVPSLLRATLDAWDTAGSAPALPALRWMISNGEALAPELCARWFARFPGIPLVNMYGPTECSDDVTHAYVHDARDPALDGVYVPIGRPLRNTALYVLGDDLQPVPRGIPGELFIGGAGVGRGYLADPCRTAVTFVPDPFTGGGARMYRTGDRVVLRADGQLDFLERRDHQVKIRGHRIELGEIETAMRAVPGVADAVVTATQDGAGHKRLVGYFVTEEEGPGPETVRTALARALPGYMVPAALPRLPALPLTAHGKVDRKALPAPEFASGSTGGTGARTPGEETLCRVLAEVLGLDAVGAGDSFFALGGDSISSIQVVSRARQAGLVITARDVFLHRTPAAIAAAARPVEGERRAVEDEGVGEMPLTPVADQLRADLARLPEAAREFGQYVTVRLPAGAGEAGLRTAFQAVLDRHDALRTRCLTPVPGLWSLEVMPRGTVRAEDVVSRASVSGTGPEEVAAQVAAARRRLRPEDGLMVQAVLLDAGGPEADRLLIVIHHLCVDGVSWRILLPDLRAAWEAATAGRTVSLDPVATSFLRWSTLLAEQARSSRRVAELPLWTDQLTGPDAPLAERPADPARDVHGTAGRLRSALSAEQTAALLTTVPDAFGAEVNDVLLTGLALAVADWRRRRGVPPGRTVVELEGHGREQLADDVDLSRTVGWFTGVFPVALDLGAEVEWSEVWNGGAACEAALKRVKERLRTLPDHGVGFGLLRHLNPQTAGVLGRYPVPQIGFNYLGRFTTGSGEDWSMETAASGQTAHPDTPLRYPVEIVSMTEDRPEGPVLVADWTWPGELLAETDVRELADGWFRALGALAALAERPGAGGHTPSQFPLVRVEQREIEAYEREPGGLHDILPLSPLQRGLLFQAEFDRHGMDAYTLQVIMDVAGPLDPAVLRTAVAALLERNPGLRASFRDRDADDPVQVVAASVELPWEEVDLTGTAEADPRADTEAGPGAPEAALDRLTDREWLRRFDVSRAPLTRFTVYRTGPERHRVVWTAHHILVDGWSLSAVLAQELVTLWGNGGDLSALPPVTPVSGYLEWSAAQDKDAARRAWRQELAGVEEPTRLGPADRARVETLPRTWTEELPEELTRTLTSWANSRGLTMNTVVQGAWAVALGRLTGREDVTFGAVVSGRPEDLPGVEQMIGSFMHTLPVRVALDPSSSFEALLDGLQARRLGLEPHQHLGLAEVQQAAGMGELFDTVVSFHNYPTGVLDRIGESVPGLSMLGWKARVIAEYPLALGVFPGRALRVEAQYRPDVFDEETVAAFVTRFRAVLETLAAEPGAALGRIDALTRAERGQLLQEWAGSPAAVREEPATGIFEGHAARTPDSTAVLAGGERTGYAELNAGANKLARLLLRRGVGPEQTVAVLLPRGPAMVEAALAVLKAGACYLPVDPAYPADRIAHMLGDARPVALLTTEATARDLADGTDTDLADGGAGDGRHTVVLDAAATVAELAELAASDVRDAERTGPLTGRHPAYVIYTSGSTGRPKGVVVEHAGMLAMVDSLVERFGLDAETRVLQFASFSFDASVWEMMLALLTGGTLVVADEECRTPGRPLVDLINGAGVNLAGLPPVVVAGLPEESRLPEGLRLAVAGEAVPAEVVARWASSVRLYNGYGPTEAVVSSTVAGPLSGTGRPPIGTPTSAHRVYVLGHDLAPAPVGVVGELYVAGGLARGYLNRPGLTAQRFVADPYGTRGERMYRTGDLVRWLPGGSLDYVGRADDQVQLRGFRIELGEITSALLAEPGVAQAAVVLRRDGGEDGAGAAGGDGTGAAGEGEGRLVAYVVPGARPEAEPAAETAGTAVTPGPPAAPAVPAGLRERLAAALPDYMVPAAFVALPELPLTAQGKLDRRALPAPAPVTAAGGRAPRTPVEEILCGLFADVLGLPQVSVDDDFFAVGGHSLLATRLVSRARGALGVELPIRALFETRTVAGLAGQVAEAAAARPALAPAADGGARPLSYAQQRLWFLNRREGRDTGTYNSPMTFRLRGRLDPEALRAALRDIAERHAVLRTVIPETGEGTPALRVLDPAEGAPALRLRQVTGEELQGALAAEYDRGFDLTAEPPLRVRLFTLGREEHVLLLVFHHIAFDGWSIGPALGDLSAAYRARRAGRAPDWAPLPAQYADYAAWQRELLGSPEDPESLASRQLDYWREQLAGLPEELTLPADFPRQEGGRHAGGEVLFELDAELYAALGEIARRSGATEFMVVQAAFAVLLSRLGAGEDIPVGSSLAGRTDEALGGLVGFFVNSLVLRTDVGGDPAFTELLGRVRETDLAAYSHQDVPFELVVEALNPPRSLGRHPLFQVMLTLQNNDEVPLELPGLEVAPEFVESSRIKVDLAMQLLRWPGDGSMRGLLGFSTDLFTRESAERIVDGFLRVLRAVAADPEVRPSRIAVLGDEERHRVLERWNDTAHEVPATTLPDLFAAQAARTPRATAVVGADGALEYAGLDERSSRLARVLIEAGAGPERTVAVALPPSPDAVTAVLAVLKSGAACLPVEASDPVERLKSVFAGTGPLAVVTTSALARRMLATGVTPVLVDGPAPAAKPGAPVTDADRLSPLLPGHAACIVHTAGTGGSPRGTVVEHRALANYLAWAVRQYPDASSDALVATPFSFDLTVTGLYVPLLTGGTVRLGELTEDDPVAAAGAAFLKGTVSHLPLLDALPAECSPRSQLVLGDEPVRGAALREWRARHPGARVVREFGPAETTVAALAAAVEPGEEIPDGSLTLGRPVWNTRAYVLDPWLGPVGPGVVGELYIAGGSLARGYAGRPGTTAERFVACPFGPPGSRMYRTGDLAAWDASGELVHRGRSDDQVRSRGFRIGLDEVGAALERHPAVGEAVVLAHEDAAGDTRLIAYAAPVPVSVPAPEPVPDPLSAPEYVTAQGPVTAVPGAGSGSGGGLTPAALETFASSVLPDYMVPSSFVVLDALPRTSGGALDRAALPAPGTGPKAAVTAPRTPEEARLCEAVAEVLGVPGVGVDENFFDAGMDSLKSLRLVGAARTAGFELTIADVFVHQNVAGLVRAAAGQRLTQRERESAREEPRPAGAETRSEGAEEEAGGPGAERRSGADVMAGALGEAERLGHTDPFGAMLCIKPSGSRPPVFCVHSGVGFSLPYLPLARHLGAEHPIYGIQAPCVVDFAPLPRSVEEIAADYIARIAEVRPKGPYHLLGWSFGGTIAYEMAVQLRAAGEEVGLLSVLDAYPRTGVADDRGEQALYAWLLEGIGHHGDEFGDRPLTVEDIFGALRADGSPLAAMGEKRMARMVDLMRHHQTLKSLYAPGPYDGRMQLFVSRSPLSDGERADPEEKTALWRPVFDGPMDVHHVACTHDDMMGPGPLAQIGPAVAAELARLHLERSEGGRS